MKKILLIVIAFAVIGLSARGQTAYIANYGNNNVSVINVSTNMVTDSIPVGAHPYGICASLDGSRVYTANNLDNTVSVINTTSKTVIATIAVGIQPFYIAVSPDGSRVYTTNAGDSSVSVINTYTNTIVSTVAILYPPGGIVVSPDGSKVYVAKSNTHSVEVINSATNTITASIALGVTTQPKGLAISPDGSKLYVSDLGNFTVIEVNTTTNLVSATIPVGQYPYGIAVSPNGRKLYVTNQGSNNLSIINAVADTVINSVQLSSFPMGVSVSPEGRKIYVAVTSPNGAVIVIDSLNNTITDSIVVDANPFSIGNFMSIYSGATACSAQFTIYADTFQLHHYYIVNNALGTAPLRYDWTWGDGNYDTISYPVHTYDSSGFYDICLSIIDSNGCSSIHCDTSFHILRTANTVYWVNVISPSQVGIKEINQSNSISIYPNPTSNLLTITLPSNNTKSSLLNLYDIIGEKVLETYSTKSSQSTIDLSILSQGIYYLEVLMDGERVVKKVVKM